MSTVPQFSIITVNYCNAELLIEVLDKTMQALNAYEYEVIIVDNCSSDTSLEILNQRYKDCKHVKVFPAPKNGGFGYGCNLGALNSSAEKLWFLNSDAWVSSAGGLERALRLLENADTGMVGTAVHLNDNTASPQGGGDMSFGYYLASSLRFGYHFRRLPKSIRNAILPILRNLPGIFGKYARSYSHASATNIYSSRGVGGASFLMSHATFNTLGGFDEGFFLYDEDSDLCLRSLKEQLINYIDPTVRVLTYPSATTSRVASPRLKRIKRSSRLSLIRKHFTGYRRLILTVVTHLTWRLL